MKILKDWVIGAFTILFYLVFEDEIHCATKISDQISELKLRLVDHVILAVAIK